MNHTGIGFPFDDFRYHPVIAPANKGSASAKHKKTILAQFPDRYHQEVL
jgi:hypothetical protein